MVTHSFASCSKLLEIAWLEPLLVAYVTPVTDYVGDGVVVAVLSTAAPRRQTDLLYAKGNLQRRLVRENRDGGLSR